jgi:hypothetical protein
MFVDGQDVHDEFILEKHNVGKIHVQRHFCRLQKYSSLGILKLSALP